MGTLESDTGTYRQSLAPERRLLAVEITRRISAWEDVGDELLIRSACAAFEEVREDTCRSEVSLLLTNDEEMAALNRNWREKDGPTNVLSFPLDAPYGNAGIRTLGDVVLARETIAREASARGIPACQHTAHLVVHGILHLMGYDHTADREAAEMEDLEVRILASMGHPDPYSSRSPADGEGQ